MPEYFIVTNSFAAPFFSDTDTFFEIAEGPNTALEQVVAHYKHPAGLYAAIAYQNSDAYHKGEKPIARWLCNEARAIQDLTKDSEGYSLYKSELGVVKINGTTHTIENPLEGSLDATNKPTT